MSRDFKIIVQSTIQTEYLVRASDVEEAKQKHLKGLSYPLRELSRFNPVVVRVFDSTRVSAPDIQQPKQENHLPKGK